jgi:hypothetical protein
MADGVSEAAFRGSSSPTTSVAINVSRKYVMPALPPREEDLLRRAPGPLSHSNSLSRVRKRRSSPRR